MPESARSELLKGLEHTAKECSKSNWDGYDADPVPSENIEMAKIVVKYLPEDLLDVDIYPSPAGDINLDWYRGNKVVLLSLWDSNDLGYVIGTVRPIALGNTSFDGVHLPGWIIEAVRNLSKEES